MLGMFNGNRAVALIFLALGVLFLYTALTFRPGFVDESLVMGPMSYPKWLFIAWLILSVIYFLTGKKSQYPVDLSRSAAALLGVLAIIAAYFFLFPVLGLPLATFLFLIAFCLFEGMRNFRVVVPFAAFTALAFWYVFEIVLKISMPRGVLDLLS